MGLIVESTLNKNVKNLIPENSLCSLHLDQYQRGWFSSKATLGFKVQVPAQTLSATEKHGAIVRPGVNFDLNFPLTINHGPIICTDSGIRFGMGHVTTTPQTHYNVLIDYLNKTRFSYTFPSFSYNSMIGSQNLIFEFLGLQAKFRISSIVDNVSGNIDLYGLNGSIDNAALHLSQVSNTFEVNRTPENLWVGHSSLTVPSILANQGNKKFELEAFNFAVDSDVTDGAFNITYDASLKKLLADNKSYGPVLIKLNIKNLDPASLARMNQLILKMMQTNQDSQLFQLSLLAELPKLLSKGSELNLSEMTFNLPEGQINGHLKIILPKDETSNSVQIMQKAHGEGQFKAPMTLVRSLMVSTMAKNLKNQAPDTQTPNPTAQPGSTTPTTIDFNAQAQKQVDQMLTNYVEKGILKVDGTDYVLILKLENQQFMVNGKPFNPDMLKN